MRIKRYPRYNRRRTAFAAVCCIIAAVTMILLVDAKLRPAVYDLAQVEAISRATGAVNSAVETQLAGNAPDYEDIVRISTDALGNITCLSTDIIKLNSLKAAITDCVNNSLSQMEQLSVTVPLGSATGIGIFAGNGPHIDIDLSTSSATIADFKNEFISAGINQTGHSIMLHIKTTVIIILPNCRKQAEIETDFCVAQTVIVGNVPLANVN